MGRAGAKKSGSKSGFVVRWETGKMKKIYGSNMLFRLFDRTISGWHREEKHLTTLDEAVRVLGGGTSRGEGLISDIIAINSFLWHEEDKARANVLPDSAIAKIKHSIDTTNQRRANKIEEIDRHIIDMLSETGVKPKKGAGLNSETPGAIADRLSILALKIRHMTEETERADASAEHREKCGMRLRTLKEQKKDLSGCFDGLVGELFKGRKKLKMYYQFKMYNDPSTNPWMRKKAK
jgi:hypothetical protein